MIVLAAVLALVSLGLGWVARRPLTPEGAAPLAVTGGLVALVGVGVLSIFGAMLKATTHHRGLGGVTFAIVGLVAVLGLVALVGAWAPRLARRAGSTRAELLGLALAALSGLGGAFLARASAGGAMAFAAAPIAAAVGWGIAARRPAPLGDASA